jgi:hypothetical protein
MTNTPLTDEQIYGHASPQHDKRYVRDLSFFRDTIHSPSRVLYPCCNIDATPVKAFPDAHIDFLDDSPEKVAMFKRRGLDAVCADVNTATFDAPHDLVLWINPGFMPSNDTVLRYSSSDGYIIGDNHYWTGRNLLDSDAVRLVGMIRDIDPKLTTDPEVIKDIMRTDVRSLMIFQKK